MQMDAVASRIEKRAVGRRTAVLVIVAVIFVVALVWWRVTAPQAEPGPADASWSWMMPEDPDKWENFKARVIERRSQWSGGGQVAPAGK